MPPPYVAGAQCRIIGEIHGQTTVNVVNFATNTVVSDDNIDELLLQLATAMAQCVVETLLPAVTSDWRFVRTEAYRIHPLRTDPVIASGTPANVGELGPASASFLSTLVHLRTGQGGRTGRGKMFLPPPGEAQTANSVIDEPTLVLIAAFLACVASKFAGLNPETPWILGVLSRKLAGANIQSFDSGFREVRQLTPSADIAKMGSRKKGRGI